MKVAPLVLSLLVLGVFYSEISSEMERKKGRCNRPTGSIGQRAVCKRSGKRYKWIPDRTPECAPVLSGINYGDFAPDYEITDTTFQCFNIITNEKDEWNGNLAKANYWLSQDNVSGPVARCEYDIGCLKLVKGFMIKNTHNTHINDRGTENFTISVRATQTADWMDVLNDALANVWGLNPVPIETFNIVPAIPTRFIRFQVNSFYGKGGGLQFFVPI